MASKMLLVELLRSQGDWKIQLRETREMVADKKQGYASARLSQSSISLSGSR